MFYANFIQNVYYYLEYFAYLVIFIFIFFQLGGVQHLGSRTSIAKHRSDAHVLSFKKLLLSLVFFRAFPIQRNNAANRT